MIWPTPNGSLGRSTLLTFGSIVIFLALSCFLIGLTPTVLLAGLTKSGTLLSRIFVAPDVSFFPELARAMLETVAMALLGSLVAIPISAFLAYFASRRTAPFQPLATLIRAIVAVARALPDLIWAIAFVSVFGLGATAGVATLCITTLAFLTKFNYESLDVVPVEPEYGVAAHGGSKLAVRLYGILPSALADWISQWIYSFDSNVRSASILGYVGAGGIGFAFTDSIRLSRYDRLGPIILSIFAVLWSLDRFGDWQRRRLR